MNPTPEELELFTDFVLDHYDMYKCFPLEFETPNGEVWDYAKVWELLELHNFFGLAED